MIDDQPSQAQFDARIGAEFEAGLVIALAHLLEQAAAPGGPLRFQARPPGPPTPPHDMNYFTLLAPAIQIAESIGAAVTALIAAVPGTAVPLPAIRTYLGALHLEIDISIKTIAP